MHFYVFVRLDIPIEDQMVQVGHACNLAGKRYRHHDETNMVLLGVKDQDKLLEAAEHVESMNIKHYMFNEPDDNMGYTAFATEMVLQYQRAPFRKKYNKWRYDGNKET